MAASARSPALSTSCYSVFSFTLIHFLYERNFSLKVETKGNQYFSFKDTNICFWWTFSKYYLKVHPTWWNTRPAESHNVTQPKSHKSCLQFQCSFSHDSDHLTNHARLLRPNSVIQTADSQRPNSSRQLMLPWAKLPEYHHQSTSRPAADLLYIVLAYSRLSWAWEAAGALAGVKQWIISKGKEGVEFC